MKAILKTINNSKNIYAQKRVRKSIYQRINRNQISGQKRKGEI